MFHTTERLMTEESSSSGVVSTANSRSFHIRRGLSTQDRGPRGGIFSLTDTEDDVQFDTSDSDNNCEVLLAGRQYPSIQEFASAIPNQLLLGSLLEHLCFVYESDPARSRMLFKVIGQRLAAMNLLSPLAISDEFSTVRLQHNRAFTELLHATSSSLFPQEHRYLSTEGQSLRTKDGLFQAHTSRYLSELEEIATLGKGSYGKVFKVTNKLDGQEYAVKKILIKKVTRDDCMKVLREVKVLSNVQFHLMLYIQMQLCERSLKDWIQERNSRITEGLLMSVDPCESVDSEHALKILKKILEGVEYIHSRGIMHRDLKPRNIFLHGPECHVKIGDFGLACQNIIMDEHEQRPSSSQAGVNTDSAHTSGVGTFVYAAPEQLECSHYDSKSDLYSIGVIAFELFQPFGTEMERVHTLGELRQGKIPNTLSKSWPLLAKYITLLTSSDPLVRPSASQLLQSDLFSANDMVIHSLKRKLDEQEEEIVQLRRQISELQISQNAIHSPENI
ncbi:eukaryotic translation initiation factor 2-alpha kinase 1-like [Sinocyclocheilus rhinocerous]|uniref:eukaryotic translation initiation factor 2-alpha kinase 1-like n=1 Tax=Sinocyclocheilus rhinocerous TaxID=307959 RepID=UPI0007BACE0F|nr:PREDICTED: eukaryotic translation initiation factor 2-alpha kinase 1-like [Sinocyclocheilus rhinocerous]